MTKQEFLDAFRKLGPDDQAAIRAEIGGSPALAGGACDPAAMRQQMMEIMKRMEAAEDPMSCCRDMMGMCQQMIQKLAGHSGR
jgi:hypothetical protein